MKPFWASKTIWFNGVIVLSAVIANVTSNPEFIKAMNPSTIAMLGVVNLFLRFVTTQPILNGVDELKETLVEIDSLSKDEKTKK